MRSDSSANLGGLTSGDDELCALGTRTPTTAPEGRTRQQGGDVLAPDVIDDVVGPHHDHGHLTSIAARAAVSPALAA